MREANSLSTVRGVGTNPVLAWGRLKIEPDTEPVLEHGLGLSAEVVDGKLVVQIDPGVRSFIWTPLVSAIGTETGVIVESFDERAGTFVVVTKKTGEGPVTEEPPAEEPAAEPAAEEPPAEEPPAEEPPAEEPPAEEPAVEEPAAAPVAEAVPFVLAPVAAGAVVYVSMLVLGVGQ